MSDKAENVSAVENSTAAINLNADEDFVDPWNVESQSDTGIDYDKLISKYFSLIYCIFNLISSI